jgi:transposase
LPAHLPRVEVLVDVEDKSCPAAAGPARDRRGHERDARHRPAQLRVKVIRRPRYGCRACEEAVVQAPAPERPITGGMATEALLAHVLVAKYSIHLPLYRPGADLRPARDRARPLHALRLGGPGLLVAGAAVAPLAPARHGSTRIFADDTRLPVLDPGRGRTKTGRLWGYAVDDRPWAASTPPAVVYLYAEDRKGEHPAAHLAGVQGVLQVDGYAASRACWTGRPPDRIKLAFCWAHCRRGFYELHRSTGSPLAEEALRRIGELYAIEAEIRGRPAEERRASGRSAAADRGGPARLAHGPARAGLGQVRPGRGAPLRPTPLAGVGAVPRGR